MLSQIEDLSEADEVEAEQLLHSIRKIYQQINLEFKSAKYDYTMARISLSDYRDILQHLRGILLDCTEPVNTYGLDTIGVSREVARYFKR